MISLIGFHFLNSKKMNPQSKFLISCYCCKEKTNHKFAFREWFALESHKYGLHEFFSWWTFVLVIYGICFWLISVMVNSGVMESFGKFRWRRFWSLFLQLEAFVLFLLWHLPFWLCFFYGICLALVFFYGIYLASALFYIYGICFWSISVYWYNGKLWRRLNSIFAIRGLCSVFFMAFAFGPSVLWQNSVFYGIASGPSLLW